VEEIQDIKEEESEEEYEEDENTLATPDVGELLVIRRALHANEVSLEPRQREQIFYIRCTIGGNVCKLIIGGGSCTNVASSTLVEKLQVPTKVHPTSYTLQWLKQENEVTVSKQALTSFLVGHYCCKVLCDVLPMDACHILLSRAWLFDNHVIHDGHTNTYALKFKGCGLTSAPLPPPKPLKIKPGKGSEKILYMSET